MDQLTLHKNYQDGVTLITPTGFRQQAFTRCEHYVARQSYLQKNLPLQWIVVDDGKIPIVTTMGQEYYKLLPQKNKSKSICTNYAYALERVKYKNIFFIEDDDWYRSTYIERTLDALKQWDLVGYWKNRYYNVKEKKYYQNHNTAHSSLCSSAITSNAIFGLHKIVIKLFNMGGVFIDLRLWRLGVKKKVIDDKSQVVGIKGMPGRLGPTHTLNGRRKNLYKEDNDFSTLKEWIGPTDASFYETIF